MFGDDDGKEYIYKEPKVTSLAEVSARLQQIYSIKHGKDAIKLILESAKVRAAAASGCSLTDVLLQPYEPAVLPTQAELQNQNLHRRVAKRCRQVEPARKKKPI